MHCMSNIKWTKYDLWHVGLTDNFNLNLMRAHISFCVKGEYIVSTTVFDVEEKNYPFKVHVCQSTSVCEFVANQHLCEFVVMIFVCSHSTLRFNYYIYSIQIKE
jgi:hypothetical protein